MCSSIFKSLLTKVKENEKFRLLACAASGILSSLPFFFDKLFILQWIAFVPFFLLFTLDCHISKRQAFLYGFLTSFIRSVIVLTWFKELYSMSVVDVPPILMLTVIFLGDVGLSALQSIPFGICSVLIHSLIKKSTCMPINAVCASIFYTFTEHFQTFIEQTGFMGLIGFPWVVSYVTQHKFTVGIQSASLFGANFITLLIILINILIAFGIVSKNKKRIVSFVTASSIFACNLLFGVVALATSNHDDTQALKAAVYQDNNSSYSKWVTSSKDVCDTFISDMEEYFSQGKDADIIILSETVFTTTINKDRAKCSSSGRYIYDRLCEFTEKHSCAVIFGAFGVDDVGERNSMFLIENGKANETTYNKRTLVPFGEYIPYADLVTKLVPELENFNLSGSQLYPGESTDVFDGEISKIGGIICYDSIFYYNTRNSVNEGAQILALSTNDSWYNDSSAIYQHYAQSAFRAVETGRYLIRSATTGVSGIIDDHGRTLANSGIFEKTIVESHIQKSDHKTLFVRIGYSYLYLLLILSFSYLAYSCLKDKKIQSSQTKSKL